VGRGNYDSVFLHSHKNFLDVFLSLHFAIKINRFQYVYKVSLHIIGGPLYPILHIELHIWERNFVPKKFRGIDSERFPLFRGIPSPRKSQFRSSERNGMNGIPRKNEVLRNFHSISDQSDGLYILLWVVFSSVEWFRTEFREYFSIFVPRNGIPRLFFLPRKGSERNSVGNKHLFRLFRLPRNYRVFFCRIEAKKEKRILEVNMRISCETDLCSLTIRFEAKKKM